MNNLRAFTEPLELYRSTDPERLYRFAGDRFRYSHVVRDIGVVFDVDPYRPNRISFNEQESIFWQGYHELESAGIPLPVCYTVIGGTAERPHGSVYAVTETIQKANPRESPDSAKKAESLIGALGTYFERKMTDESSFLKEIAHLHQYVFGYSKRSSEPDWYLVDLDPWHHDIYPDFFVAALHQMGNLLAVKHNDQNLRRVGRAAAQSVVALAATKKQFTSSQQRPAESTSD